MCRPRIVFYTTPRIALLFLSTLLNSVVGINLSAQQWKRFGELHTARHVFGALYIGKGKILVAGGQAKNSQTRKLEPINSCEIINVYTGTVTLTDSMSVPRAEFSMLLTKDSNVVVVGGVRQMTSVIDNRNTALVELYDRSTHQWRVLGSLLVARRQHAAVFINDEEILVACGRVDNLDGVRSAEIFNIHTGLSRRIADYPYPVNHMNIHKTQGMGIIAFGGREGGPTSERYNEVYEYKPEYNIWIQKDTIYAGVYGLSSIELWNGRLLLCGGSSSEKPPDDVNLRKEFWVESNNSLQPLGTLENARAVHSVAQVNNHSIVVAGGTVEQWIPSSSSEIINTYSGNSVHREALREPHAYHCCVAVPLAVESGLSYVEHTILCISGIREIVHDDRGNHLDVVHTPLIEILENPECAFRTMQVGFSMCNTVGSAQRSSIDGGKDTVLLLTPDKPSQIGALWTRDKMYLADGFRASFSFSIADGNDDNFPDSTSVPGGDGFALVIHNDHTTTLALGAEGKGLGYAGILNSLAIEFDLYANRGNITRDPDGNHIAVQTNRQKANSSQHKPEYTLGKSSRIPAILPGVVYYAMVEYKDYRLRVYVDTVAIDVKSLPPTLEVEHIDMESLLRLDQGSGYIGFTAATGGTYQKHYIRSWKFEECLYK